MPSLVLDIPAYGVVFMNTPEDPLTPSTETETPRNDVIVHGELVITMPSNLGRRRVKWIKVGIKSVLKLDLRPGRMNEEDVLFEREVELAESDSCQCWLQEGTTIFDFNLIIPANHPPHDWHNNGTLRHFLYAEIEGLPKAPSSGFLSFRSRSHGPGSKSPSGQRSPRHTASPSRSRSNSPAPAKLLDAALLEKTIGTLSLEGKGKAPSYADSTAASNHSSSGSTTPTAEEDWLKGTYRAERTLILVYNPSPTGEVNMLDLRLNGVADQLGVWDLKLQSNPVSTPYSPS